MKFDALQIHFLSDVFIAIAMAWTNKNNNDCIETNQKQLFQIRPNTTFNTIQNIINKPSYLTEAWLPEVDELLDDKGVGLSVNDRFGFDNGSGSVCVWYCWLMSRFAPPLGESRCSVWLYFIDDSLDTVWLDALGGGAGMCLGLPVEWCNKTEQHNQTLAH